LLFGSREQVPNTAAKLNYTNWRVCPLVGFQLRKWDFIIKTMPVKVLGKEIALLV
jgi:hypothetical protein